MATETQEEAAARVHRLFKQLGSAIEDAVDLELSVSVEVWFHHGSEAITLHDLNGEFIPTVSVFEEIPERTAFDGESKSN